MSEQSLRGVPGWPTHTRQQHQIIIRLEVFRAHHEPSRGGSKTDDHDGHSQKRECLSNEITHGFAGEIALLLFE